MLSVLITVTALGAAFVALPAAAAAVASARQPALRTDSTRLKPRRSAADCSELFFEQPLNQFNYNEQRNWQQRFFLCTQFLRRDEPAPSILFYGELRPRTGMGGLPHRLRSRVVMQRRNLTAGVR